MKCESCGSETIKKQVTRQHWLKSQLYIVENVEAEVCMECGEMECGERYFHATTLDAIDQLLSSEHVVKENLNVEVVSLEQRTA